MSEVATKELPEGWQLCKLGDVMRLKNGYAFKSKDYSESGTPLIRISDLKEGVVNIDKTVCIPDELVHEGYFVESGDLLIAMSGATTGKIGVYKGTDPVLQNQRVGNFKIIDESVVDKKYRDYFVSSLRKEIEGAAYGGAQPNISAKGIEAFEFPLAPPEQQKHIVAKIEELFSHIDAGIEALKKAKQLLKQYRQSVLKAAVTGELTKEWRVAQGRASVAGGRAPGATEAESKGIEPASQLLERILKERRQKWEEQQLEQFKAKGKIPKDDKWKEKYKAAAPFDSEDMPELPEQWKWATLDEIGQADRPIIYGIIKPGPHVEDGVRYVRVTEMKTGTIDVSVLKKTSKERAAKFARATLKTGDILISKDGTIGKVAIVPPELEGGNITQHVMRAPVHNSLSNRYVEIAILSPVCQLWLASETKGVALKGVNVEDFRRLPIPVPSPVEQEEIVRMAKERLDAIQRLENDIEMQSQKAEKNKQSILASAFSGKIYLGYLR